MVVYFVRLCALFITPFFFLEGSTLPNTSGFGSLTVTYHRIPDPNSAGLRMNTAFKQPGCSEVG